jgi:cellulose synthase/poly-beta-1,6-N-acetylglucosamine synthase-like glycosyltransferase
MLLLLFIISFFLYSLLLFYYYKGWHKGAEFTTGPVAKDPVFISVVVAARNEEKNIGALLRALEQQTFPTAHFEVIVVDDFSSDATASTAGANQLQNFAIIQPSVAADYSSKKKAIEAGIARAKGDIIVTTDADCIPTPQWLHVIHGYYSKTDASFVAAPVKFFYNSSLLQIFQALDFLILQGITAASAASGFNAMCNGANLSYKKQSFKNVNGFEGIDKVATGDDMLLMHKIAKMEPGKVHYLKSKDAIVSTEPMATWKDLLMQRRRWASKTFLYDDYRLIVVLVFVYVFNFFFFVLIFLSISNPANWWYVLSFWVLKTGIEWPFVHAVARFYNEQKLLNYFFFLQPLHILYTVVVGALSQFGKYQWKGRRTK